MNGKIILEARSAKKWEQIETAEKLGISQPYLSLIERGKRKVTKSLALRAVEVFGLPPSNLPVNEKQAFGRSTAQEIAEDIAALGYAPFSHLNRGKPPRNPAEILFDALNMESLDARSIEALPWLIYEYTEMNWLELLRAAKLSNMQNKLGFLTALARKIAEKRDEKKKTAFLESKENILKKSRLYDEAPLFEGSITKAELKWLEENRTEDAKFWRILSDLNIENLRLMEI